MVNGDKCIFIERGSINISSKSMTGFPNHTTRRVEKERPGVEVAWTFIIQILILKKRREINTYRLV